MFKKTLLAYLAEYPAFLIMRYQHVIFGTGTLTGEETKISGQISGASQAFTSTSS